MVAVHLIKPCNHPELEILRDGSRSLEWTVSQDITLVYLPHSNLMYSPAKEIRFRNLNF